MTTTNLDKIAKWYTERPEWTKHFKARDWDTAEIIARALDRANAPVPESCLIATRKTGGRFYCTRQAGHDGPCAAVPDDLGSD